MARTLEVIGEWWTLLIVRDLFFGIRTFDALCKDLGIARNILAARLKKLEEQKVVEKIAYQERPPRYRYQLTNKGKDLYPLLVLLVDWGNRWESERGPIIELYHDQDAHTIHPQLVCSTCREPIDPTEIRLRPGPGATQTEPLPSSLLEPDELPEPFDRPDIDEETA